MDAIAYSHGNLIAEAMARGEDIVTWIGCTGDMDLRLDANEAAGMAGLDIKIDALFNGRGETTALFVGDATAAQAEGIGLASEIYATSPVEGQDAVVMNIYAKANEGFLALPLSMLPLRGGGGDLVLIANSPEGFVTHYLAGSFGTKMGGRLWLARTSPPPNVDRTIMFTTYVDRAGAGWFGPAESVVWAKTWAEVIDLLAEKHGENVKVAVVPDATLQYFAQ